MKDMLEVSFISVLINVNSQVLLLSVRLFFKLIQIPHIVILVCQVVCTAESPNIFRHVHLISGTWPDFANRDNTFGFSETHKLFLLV